MSHVQLSIENPNQNQKKNYFLILNKVNENEAVMIMAVMQLRAAVTQTIALQKKGFLFISRKCHQDYDFSLTYPHVNFKSLAFKEFRITRNCIPHALDFLTESERFEFCS